MLKNIPVNFSAEESQWMPAVTDSSWSFDHIIGEKVSAALVTR